MTDLSKLSFGQQVYVWVVDCGDGVDMYVREDYKGDPPPRRMTTTYLGKTDGHLAVIVSPDGCPAWDVTPDVVAFIMAHTPDATKEGLEGKKAWSVPSHYLKPALSAAPSVQRSIGGASCKNCSDFVPYAEPNRPDGSFVCYLCRSDPFRMSFGGSND